MNPQLSMKQPGEGASDSPNLVRQYIAANGMPPNVEFGPEHDADQLTLAEQQEMVAILEKLAKCGDDAAGRRLNDLWDEAWDRLDSQGADRILTEAEKEGTVPLREYMRQQGIPCTPSS